MRRLPLVALILWAALCAVPAAQPPATLEESRPIFRLSVSLVQLDAVVTDRKGRHVTTLGPEDFIVEQDGRPQAVTAVSYVTLDDRWVPLEDDVDPALDVDPRPTKPEDARRTIAVVVDDLRMGFESIHHARRGLMAFVDDHVRPDDLVAILPTAGAPRGTRPFTYSRAEMRAAVSRLRFSLDSVSPASALDPITPGFELDAFDQIESFRRGYFAVDAIGMVERVVEVLRGRPGRKAVILVSEGFSFWGPDRNNARVQEALRRLVDRTNRAGVVLYAIDPRGLVPTGITAADATGGMSGRQLAGIASRRGAALRETQDGLRYLAGETGGFAIVNTNDLGRGMRRIIDDQQGYYLIGYQPEEGTFGPDGRRKFRSLKIKVTRKGLKVRTRSGFYGVRTE